MKSVVRNAVIFQPQPPSRQLDDPPRQAHADALLVAFLPAGGKAPGCIVQTPSTHRNSIKWKLGENAKAELGCAAGQKRKDWLSDESFSFDSPESNTCCGLGLVSTPAPFL